VIFLILLVISKAVSRDLMPKMLQMPICENGWLKQTVLIISMTKFSKQQNIKLLCHVKHILCMKMTLTKFISWQVNKINYRFR